MITVLFVCRANICRSPTAHGVFKKLVFEAGLDNLIAVDSAGTDAPYPDRLPDARARAAAQAGGYDISDLSAQQLTSDLAADSDYIIVMDDKNYSDAGKIISADDVYKMHLLLSYTNVKDQQLRDPFFSGSAGHGFIPDPIDSGESAFTSILGKIETACGLLLQHIIKSGHFEK